MGVQKSGEWLFDWPVDGQAMLTQGFINDGNGIDIVTNAVQMNGLEFIHAAESGTVDQLQYWDGRTKTGMQSYGNMVRINHGVYDGGVLQTRYAHMSKLLVKKGQNVYRGQIIGYMGSTGNATGKHLHFEVLWKGRRYNPLNWLDNNFVNKYASVVNGVYKSVERDNAVNLYYINAGPLSSGDFKKVTDLLKELNIQYTTK
jgi:murein DD-endopeptidase MepM/ murein hydrolase activator NlpD